MPAPGVQHEGRQRFQGGVRLEVTVREEGETNPNRAIVAHPDLARVLSIPSALTGYPGADLAHLAPAAPVLGHARAACGTAATPKPSGMRSRHFR